MSKTKTPGTQQPQNLEAERSVLGACLLDGTAAVAATAILRPHDFFSRQHALIFEAIMAAQSAGHPTNPIAVGEVLSRRGRLEEAGGHDLLLDLLESVLTGAAISYHAGVVRDYARRRILLQAAREIELHAANGQDADALLALLEEHLSAARLPAPNSTALSPCDVLAQWVAEGPLVHVPTGFATIDKLTGGGPPFGARCYVLGAPDAGKTTVLVQVADQFLSQGIDVGFLAVDEEPGDVLMRFLQRRGFARQDCERRDKQTLAAMRESMSDVGLSLYGDEISIEAAAEDLAARAAKHGRRAAFFVDSIQTAHSASEAEGASFHSIVTRRTRVIRAATTKHRFVSYITSEMSRAAYRSIDSAERIADMAAAKESGAIEYTARFMVSLRSAAGAADVIEASITKNKFGPSTRDGEAGFHLRLDRAAQILTEDSKFVAPSKATRDEQRATERAQQAIADAAVLALVIVDEPGIAKTDAENEFMQRAKCGTKRWMAAWSMLRKAISVEPGPRNRLSLFLDGAKIADEVVDNIGVADRPRVIASRSGVELHRAAPSSTDGAGAPPDELHPHPLRSRGGATHRCSSEEEGAAPTGVGAAQRCDSE